MAAQDPLALARAQCAHKIPASPVYTFLLKDVEIVSATAGYIKARLQVSANHLNSHGSVHGTTSQCIVDWAGGMAIASTGREKTGVSTDIHVSYLSTAKEGDALEIECKASKVGSTMAYTTVEVRRESDGAIVCTGSHTKFIR